MKCIASLRRCDASHQPISNALSRIQHAKPCHASAALMVSSVPYRHRCMQRCRPSVRVRCAPASVRSSAGLILAAEGNDAWDGGAVYNPVVRVFPGEEGSRWFMWYTGRQARSSATDAVFPAAGVIGVLARLLQACSCRRHCGLNDCVHATTLTRHV